MLKKSTIFIVLAFAVGLTNCKKKPNLTAKSKTLMGKSWKLDADAQRKEALGKLGKATGITNMGALNPKKDVKKFFDTIQAKSLFFGTEKGGSGLVYKVTYGKSLLSTSKTGYWEWNADETKLTLKGAGKDKGKDTTYAVKELTDKKLVLMKLMGSPKGSPKVAGAADTAGAIAHEVYTR